MRDSERRALARARAGERVHARRHEPGGSATLWADGGSRGNPGPSAFAFVLEAADGTRLSQGSESAGVSTATVAEYRGLVAGLREATRLDVRPLEVRLDAELVVEQVQARQPVDSEPLRSLLHEARALVDELGDVTFRWVPGDENLADPLVASALGLLPRPNR